MDGRTFQTHKKTAVLILLACAVVLAAFGCLMVGSSGMTVSACLDALLGRTGGTAARIIWGIRIPRLLAALIAGAGLSVSGLLMQTSLGNAMASPSTLGVSHAAVFGANLSIIAFAGGFLNTGHNPANFDVGVNPFAASLLAFLFGLSAAGVALIPLLCAAQGFFLSFSVCCFAAALGRDGVLLALAALGLRCLFVLPCTLCLADAGFAQACRAMPRLRPRRPELNWRMLLFCVFVLLTGTVVECAIVPKFFALILARIA